ncbi:MAG: hypothetical protein QOI66_2984 [Myxococcales bacterium]|nr:hypothetical protein [Myxococcales bacterium]
MSSTEIETTSQTEPEIETTMEQSMIPTKEQTPRRRSFLTRLRELKDSRGSGTIEKIFIIALFIFVAAAGLKILGTKTKDALEKQGEGIERTGQTAAPN